MSKNEEVAGTSSSTAVEKLLLWQPDADTESLSLRTKSGELNVSMSELNDIIGDLEKRGFKAGLFPDADSMGTAHGVSLMLILVKIDTTRMGWRDGNKRLQAAIATQPEDVVQVIGIGTCAGWEYDFVLLAYVKEIGQGYGEWVEAIQASVPLVEIVGRPFLWMTYFDPRLHLGS